MTQFIYNPLVLKTATLIDYRRRHAQWLPMSNSQINCSDRLPNPDYKTFTNTTHYIELITQAYGAVRQKGCAVSKKKVSCFILRWEKTTPDFYTS